MTDAMAEQADVEGRKDEEVTVHDENDGSVFHHEARPDSLVGATVDAFYAEHIKRERRPNDRLRCESDGNDVFDYLAEHLQRYKEDHCRHLVWLFAGDKGGASA